LVQGVKDYAIFMLDPQGRVVSWNPGAERMKGYKAEEIIGEHFSRFYTEDDAQQGHPEEELRIAAAEGSYEEEGVRVRKDGTKFWAHVVITALKDEADDLRGFAKVQRDITERKQAEEEIEARAAQQSIVAGLGVRALREEDLQAVMEESVALVARTLNVEYCEILEILPCGEGLLLLAGVGWREGLVGKATVGTEPDSQAGYTLATGEPVVVENLREEERFSGPPLLHEHGVVSGISVVIQGRDGPFGVLGTHTAEHRIFSADDVNFVQAVANVLAAAVGRRRAEEALIEVREAERSRIARDIHDEAMQDIVYALMEIDTHRHLFGEGQQDAGLEAAANALRHSIAGLRDAIFDLSLAGREEDGDFVERLESLVRLNRQSSPDREIELSVQGNLPRSLGKRTEVELQRVVQEALANVRRHSEASRVSVTVGAAGGKLWAEVEDDGRGFGPEIPAGMGTRGMRERALALGGALYIESEPGKGTKVRLEMNLAREGEEPQPEEKTRVLLVEDHASFREAAASVFEQEPGFEVVGQAGSLAEARKVLEDGAAAKADVAIVDLGLPDGYGGELIKDLREAHPQAQALVLSATLERSEIARAVEAGAAGVLHKSEGIEKVVEDVRRLRAGETLLPVQEVVELLRFASSRRDQEREEREALARLTPREIEVLEALAEGLDGKEIAQRLSISPTTERNHVASILAKLGVHSRLQALVFALRHGIVRTP
jgi:PAS domain S-box-containing protein